MSYIGRVEQKASDIRRVNVTGSTSATHTLTWTPPNEQSLIITINGVKQQNNYTISGTTLTLDTALTSSDAMEVVGILDIGETTIPGDNSVTTAKIQDDAVTADKIADDAVGIATLSATGTASSSTYLRGDNSWASVPEYNDSGLQDDIAILGFKVAANGSLGKYDLVDQTIDAFEDATGIDASTSTGEIRNASNYYSGVSVGTYSINAITSTGASTWTCPSDTTQAEVLIVGGGAGGGNHYYGGGGGAGGVVHDTDYTVVAGTVYDITVGAGGSAATTGSDSVWNVNAEGSGITMTADGGGRGGDSSTQNGVSGGSGGGGSGYGIPNTGGSSSQTSPTGATGYGNAGGGSGSNQGGAGGGGANAVGQNSPGTNNEDGGYGGAGKLFSNFTAYGTTSGNVASSGSDGGYFGGGGGGGGYPGDNSNQGGAGGVGGGGKGGKSYDTGSTYQAVAGMANTGGGGGGGSGSSSFNGKAGGSGVVLIRHRTEAYNNMTLVSNATTAQAVPTTGDIVMTYTNGSGTATVNTDIKAYISRNNGTTWTQATLSSEGTTGGHTILTAHNVDISSQSSGTSMRYKIETLNQSASKETRIQAASLGWA